MSDTPRTDEFSKTLHSWTGDEAQCLDFARSVETELHETRKLMVAREMLQHEENDRELARIKTQRDAWKQMAIELIGCIPEPPAPNCACHISPPCNDCTEHSYTRDLFERFKKLEKAT